MTAGATTTDPYATTAGLGTTAAGLGTTAADPPSRGRAAAWHQRLPLRAAGFAFVTYKALHDALTTGAGLIHDPRASAVVAAGLCAALPLSRRWPTGVAVVALAGFLLESQLWPALVALYGVTVRRPTPLALGLAAAAGLAACSGAFRDTVNMPLATYLPTAMLVIPAAFGLVARSHRELARSLADQLDHVEAANRLRDDQVRLAERARIAREMHDVLAHRLSLLVLHTGVLQRRGGEVPEPIRERLGLLRDTSAHALDDLRDLLGALRDHEGPVPLTPTADDLPALIAESEAAGTRVRATVGELAACPAAVRLAVHRIVQEALTNARKHAPAEPVDLTVMVERSRVEVRAENPCPPGPGPAAAPGPRGYGLVGVAERVAALHGELTVGRTDGGRFLLRAQLPVPAHPAEEARTAEGARTAVAAGAAGEASAAAEHTEYAEYTEGDVR
ncbi:histidine kinase [Streptomyces sp. B1866]|uniref:sensor histidine kinase n=1 Tax=Streptomyces sp. B1866 TaxID=3075431 RepID=UPI002892067F|nr:histidine kinase [Streptomyces sp. B1866]MDT3395995.1 histidine kinase [Streptomyces sp. B1866]